MKNDNNIQLIIVSANSDLRDYTLRNISFVNEIKSKLSFNNILAMSAFLNRFTNNIVLIDTDTQSLTTSYLKFLREKYHMTIVLIKGKKSIEFSVRREFQQIIERPDLSDIFQARKYIDAIVKIIRAAHRTGPSNLFEVMNNTINESQRIIAIASSTGGTTALEFIFKNLPDKISPILIVQHMTIGFTRFFADSLNKKSKVTVVEAKHGDYLKMNTAYIAPSGKHMTLVKKNQKLSLECFEGERVFGVIPSADVLFKSIAPIMKTNVIGVILTGMGSDGARGLLEMRTKGARTIGQDEKSSIVYGMPKVAKDINAVEFQLPLEKIPKAIIDLDNNFPYSIARS